MPSLEDEMLKDPRELVPFFDSLPISARGYERPEKNQLIKVYQPREAKETDGVHAVRPSSFLD